MKVKPLSEWTDEEQSAMLKILFSVLEGMADNATDKTDADPFQDYDAIQAEAEGLNLLIPEEGDKDDDDEDDEPDFKD